MKKKKSKELRFTLAKNKHGIGLFSKITNREFSFDALRHEKVVLLGCEREQKGNALCEDVAPYTFWSADMILQWIVQLI